MPLKRFLSTAAPLALLALAGMGLATAQSSSPFATQSRAQAWEQQPVAQPAYTAAPAQTFPSQSWSTVPTPPAQNMSYDAPYQAPAQFVAPLTAPMTAPSVPVFADAPIATRPRRQTSRPTAKLPTYSSTTPPKTFGGQVASPRRAQYPAQNPTQNNAYARQALAGSSVPPVSASVSAFAPTYKSMPSSTPPRGSDYSYTPPRTRAVAQAPDFGSPTPPTSAPPTSAPPQQTSPYTAPTSGSPYGSGRRPQAWENQPQNTPSQPAPTYQNPTYENQPYQNQGQQYGAPAQGPQNGYTPGYQSQVPPTGGPYSSGPYASGPYSNGPNSPVQPRSWSERLGLKNIATLFKGKLTLGGAGTYREQPPNQAGPEDGWSDDTIADAEIEVEVSAVTDGGLEYGIVLGGRAQYDEYRRGFGGRLPDCPAGIDGCSGETESLRGHTSGFYSAGEDLAKDAQGALESAHLFLRSAYGDVTIGRDDGAAYLFSLGAPTLLAVGASNSPVDYTGYDSVKTVNDASGFAEKITYTSPRLLGDQIGLGLQFGASYALDGDVCGVDYCNSKNIDGVSQPDIEDILEVGLAIDRTFGKGLRAELTGTYAHGSEKSGLAGLDNLDSYGAGLEFEYGDWTLGGSYLQSNNGLQDGDYTAYDAGLTWKPSALGFTLGYGYAEDDNVGLKSNQGTFGITYDFEKFTLGTGVQHVDRDVNGLIANIPTTLDQKATSVFVQGGFKF